MGAVTHLPLSVSAGRLDRAHSRLAELASSGDDAAFEEGLKDWFADLRDHVAQIQRASGLSMADLAELLIP